MDLNTSLYTKSDLKSGLIDGVAGIFRYLSMTLNLCMSRAIL